MVREVLERMSQGRLPRRRGDVAQRKIELRYRFLRRPARLDHGTGQVYSIRDPRILIVPAAWREGAAVLPRRAGTGW